MLQEAIRKRIIALCDEREITRHELARLACIPPSSMFQIFESRDVKLSTVKKICDPLNLTLGEFFSDPLFDGLPPAIE